MHLVYQAEYDETPAVNSWNRVNWWKRGAREIEREKEKKKEPGLFGSTNRLICVKSWTRSARFGLDDGGERVEREARPR